MLTPEPLHEQLLVELARSVADADATAHPHRHAFRRRRHALRRRFPSAGVPALVAIAGSCAIAATVILAVRWPPGGGDRVAQLAIAQGASLVFVALLLSLLPGVVDAGRSIGWEPTWILRDRLTWLGFAAVALLSVGDLTVAWTQPERPEEGATILMTACGLAITGLLARRLLRMSDPGEQLDARANAQVPRLIAILKKESRRMARRAAEQGLSEDAERLLTLTPHPGAQSGMAGVLRTMLSLSARYVQEARWDLALKAFEVVTQTVVAYVQVGKRVHLQDSVLWVFSERTNDLHALAPGPEGRDLSLALFAGMSLVGEAVARSHLEHRIREGGALHRLAFTAKVMVRRRAADESSPDPAAGLELIGMLAAASAQIGDGPSATGIADALLPFAVDATVGRQPHICGPAWASAVRVLGVLALVPDEMRDTAALQVWVDALTDAIGSLPAIPSPVALSGAEPLFSIEPRGRSLVQIIFAIWASDLDGAAKRYLDARAADALALVIASSSHEDAGSDVVVEVWHQFACAAANCAERQAEQRPLAVDALAGHLARVRGVWSVDTRRTECLHAYTTDWVLAIFVTRREEQIAPTLLAEIEAFGAFVQGLSAPVDKRVGESLSWLELALRRAGQHQIADRCAGWIRQDARPAATGRLYQLGYGRRSLHSGLLTTRILAEAQVWWLG